MTHEEMEHVIGEYEFITQMMSNASFKYLEQMKNSIIDARNGIRCIEINKLDTALALFEQIRDLTQIYSDKYMARMKEAYEKQIEVRGYIRDKS